MTIRLLLQALAVVTLALSGPRPTFAAQVESANTQTSGRYVFSGWEGPAVPVWYQLPDRVAADTPVVFVMHGVNRDADRYRDEWAALARQHGFIVVVPQFSAANFPGSLGYNTGYFANTDGSQRPRALWSFSVIEPLFDDARQRFGTQVPRYMIYGHSAGAHFGHRYVMFMPDARIEHAIAANAGWYTMPDFAAAFPYGLAASPVDAASLKEALGKPLTLLLGTADTDTNDANLRKTPQANRQGPHRYARGQAFFEQGQKLAIALGTELGWRLETVRGIGHSNADMAKAAAQTIAARGKVDRQR